MFEILPQPISFNSKKKPHASVGTHGYMSPEVLCKGMSYDSCADWFSFGCMIYKLLKGHSPFRQHKTKDKHEIDRMTLTMKVELPDSYRLESSSSSFENVSESGLFLSAEVKGLLDGLLQRDVDKRLGCCGQGAEEVSN